jgi:hypothetical protein
MSNKELRRRRLVILSLHGVELVETKINKNKKSFLI